MAAQHKLSHFSGGSKMTVYGLWNGGVNYSASDIKTDLEVFSSTNAAADALLDRARHGGRYMVTFNYADGRTEQTHTPCADEGCEMWVYFYNPNEEDEYGRPNGSNGPDRVITVGPRGGIRIERA